MTQMTKRQARKMDRLLQKVIQHYLNVRGVDTAIGVTKEVTLVNGEKMQIRIVIRELF